MSVTRSVPRWVPRSVARILLPAVLLWCAALAAAAEPVTRGPVTNFPLPRYVTMKAAEANVRRGPSQSHRIDWVFKRRDMPLRITAEHGHWRRVQDRDGMGGWVHYALLSGARSVIVEEDLMALFPRPTATGAPVARLEAGVIAKLGKCEPDWCRVSAGGYRGWAPKTSLWGVGADELRD
ncbi:MAG: SH3 domain-containing protein [Shimia sp.]